MDELAGLRCIVVGGSIGGLSAALELRRHGADVHVFERSAHVPEGRGAGLGVDLALVARLLKGTPPPHLPSAHLRWRHVVSGAHEVDEPASLHTTHYALLRGALRGALPDERYHAANVLSAVEQLAHGPVRVRFENGREAEGDVLICADGYQALSRQLLLPEGSPTQASYAGYVLWRGVLEEDGLPAQVGALLQRDTLHVVSRPPFHLVAYPVPGGSGSLAPGQRRLNWGWYHHAPSSQASALAPGQCPPGLQQEVLEASRATWPAAYHALVEATVAAGRLGRFPIHEYSPVALAAGRACLLGDAAHVASPITGAGARFAMLDALELVDCLRRAASEGALDVPAALREYERRRLAPARQLVAQGQALGAPFARPCAPALASARFRTGAGKQ